MTQKKSSGFPANDVGGRPILSDSQPPPAETRDTVARRHAAQKIFAEMDEMVAWAKSDARRGRGVVILTSTGEPLMFNAVAEETFGISVDLGIVWTPGRLYDFLSNKARILRELQEDGISLKVPCIVDMMVLAPTVWNVSVIPVAHPKTGVIRHYVEMDDITEMHARNQQLLKLASFDTLTGIPNRRTFLQGLERLFHASKRDHMPMSVAYLDVDHFKRFNDEYGHDVGDAVLIAVAQRLQAVVRKDEVCGRLGGEEFAVVLRADPIAAVEGAHRIREAISSTPVVVMGKEFKVTVSVGVCTHVNGDDHTPKSLLSAADMAMLEAKEDGRDRVRVSDPNVAA